MYAVERSPALQAMWGLAVRKEIGGGVENEVRFVPQTPLVHTPSNARAAHFPSLSSFNPNTVPPAALPTLPPHMTR